MNVATLFKMSPNDYTDTNLQWAAKKMAQLGALNTDNIRLIAKYAKQENTVY